MNEWEEIKMFRCVQDPMIGPRPKNAFMLPDLPGWFAKLHTPSGTIHVVTDTGRRHVVGMGNWSSIELYKESENGKIQASRGETAENPSTQKRKDIKPQPSKGI